MALNHIKNIAKDLPNELQETVKSHLEYYKLYTFRILAKMATGLVGLFVMGLLTLAITFFVSVGIAFALGQWLGNFATGFFIVAGLLLILCIVLYKQRAKIIYKPLLKKLSDIYFNQD